jgi:DNA-directed RNA polymerase specialized sigma24 family protein
MTDLEFFERLATAVAMPDDLRAHALQRWREEDDAAWRAAAGAGPWAATNGRGRVIGAAHHHARLSNHDVELILELREQGLSYRQIADKFQVARSTVSDICSGRRRGQTVEGHKRAPPRLRFSPAHPDEFELYA